MPAANSFAFDASLVVVAGPSVDLIRRCASQCGSCRGLCDSSFAVIRRISQRDGSSYNHTASLLQRHNLRDAAAALCGGRAHFRPAACFALPNCSVAVCPNIREVRRGSARDFEKVDRIGTPVIRRLCRLSCHTETVTQPVAVKPRHAAEACGIVSAVPQCHLLHQAHGHVDPPSCAPDTRNEQKQVRSQPPLGPIVG